MQLLDSAKRLGRLLQSDQFLRAGRKRGRSVESVQSREAVSAGQVEGLLSQRMRYFLSLIHI